MIPSNIAYFILKLEGGYSTADCTSIYRKRRMMRRCKQCHLNTNILMKKR